MLKRFKSGLFYPREVANYRDDKKITTFIYFLLLVLLTIIPSVIVAINADGLEYDDRRVIRNAFRDKDIPYQIEDFQLIRTGLNPRDYFEVNITENFKVIFTDKEALDITINPLSMETWVVFTKNKVTYSQSLIQNPFSKYEEKTYINYEIKDLDFSGAKNDDSSFWDTVFPIVNQEVNRNSATSLMRNILFLIASSAMGLIFFSLIITFFQKMMIPEKLNFNKLWQLVIYIMAPYVIFQLFENLYSLGFLSFVGTIISIIYANKLTQQLLQNK